MSTYKCSINIYTQKINTYNNVNNLGSLFLILYKRRFLPHRYYH